MLRIAITAAVLVLATGAMADAFSCSQSGGDCYWYQENGNPLTVSPGNVVQIPAARNGKGEFVGGLSLMGSGGGYTPATCKIGWTLVDVAKVGQPAIHKCAAVGDLRDPE